MLRPGDRAPDFSIPDTDMQLRSLADFRDRLLVLFFYPQDDTPGSTLQVVGFSERVGRYRKAGARAVGVSRDDCFSHQGFRDKYGLKLTLLSDVDGEACRSYGVLQEKERGGVRRTGIVRSTFVIDRGGVIRHARYGVSPGRHAHEMLRVVRELAPLHAPAPPPPPAGRRPAR